MALLFSTAYTTYGLYAVRSAALGALELVLVGTALELSITVAEVPTGVVADVTGRRRSVILGLSIIGLGFVLMGTVPTFAGLALGSMLMGIGYTFVSGAHEAWLADEIGDLRAASAYVRATQVSQVGHLIGVPVGVALASIDLRLPMVAGGAGYWVLVIVLIAVMPERGYVPVSEPRRNAWQAMRATLSESLATVRARPELASILAIMLLYGMSAEAVSRMAPLHLLHDVGLPDRFGEATWFGLLNGGAFLGGAVVTALLGRAVNRDDRRHGTPILVGLTIVMMIAMLVFATTSMFWLAVLGFWIAKWATIAIRPFLMARMNRGLPPGVRATVLSMLGQSEAVGEVCGGPVLGVVAAVSTTRVALASAAAVLFPAVLLYRPALRSAASRIVDRT